MLVLEGIPGAGKTTHLAHLLTSCPERLVLFPEAQPPRHGTDTAAMRQLLDEDHARTEKARRVEENHLGRLVASDRCHLGVLAYRYAWARLTNRWTDFHRTLAYSGELGLDERHHDDTLLILHLSPDASLQRRRHSAADPRHELWYAPDFLAAYGKFFTQLDQWATPGPRWAHHPADDNAIADTISALAASAPARPPAIHRHDLTCDNDCGTPRSAAVATTDVAVQLWSSALHQQRPGKPVRCLRTAEAIVEHTREFGQ